MCRLAAYVGRTPITLGSLIYDPPHSLQRAAYEPKELLRGRVNVDGTGVAWWEQEVGEPLRYVTIQPPWADPNLPGLAKRLKGSTVLAAVRSATPGMGFGTSNVAPFVGEGFAAVHNGWIGGFTSGVGRRLLSSLDDTRFGRLDAMNDSLALFSLVLQEMGDRPSASLADAVAGVLQTVTKKVVAAGEAATLNLVVASAGQIVATRTSANFDVNSLYTRQSDEGVWLASEPLDPDETWAALPKGSLSVLGPEGITTRPLEHEGSGT